MSLRMTLGGYNFPLGQVGYVPNIKVNLNSRGRAVSKTVQIQLTGDLLYDGYTANAQARQTLELAAEQQNVDFLLRSDRGVELIRYRAAQALRGMTPTGMAWPNPNEGQFVTMSSFTMTVEGEFQAPNLLPGDTIEYSEKIVKTGNAKSQFGWMYPINVKPVSYQARLFTTVKYVQTGQAIGWGAYPRIIPRPFVMNPKYYMQEQTIIDTGHPYGSGLKMWPISWQYFFELDYEPKNVLPTAWPLR